MVKFSDKEMPIINISHSKEMVFYKLPNNYEFAINKKSSVSNGVVQFIQGIIKYGDIKTNFFHKDVQKIFEQIKKKEFDSYRITIGDHEIFFRKEKEEIQAYIKNGDRKQEHQRDGL